MTDFASRFLAHRLRNQKLTRTALRSPADVVAWLGAVQSQDYAGAKWALGQRAIGLTDAAVDRAFDEGTILRTHILRPTWHFVVPADLRWMMALSGPRVAARCATYFRKLELDAALLKRAGGVLARALEGRNYLTRAELQTALARARIPVTGVRLAFVVMHAELDAVICSGPRRGKQFTYALFDERVPARRALRRDEALAELTSRFFASHGPATIKDFVWWSGLTVQDAKAGMAAVSPPLVSESAGDRTYWLAASKTATPPAGPTAFLLPNYDEFLVAYKDRDAGVSEVIAQRMIEGKFDSYAHPIVLGGLLAGTWRRAVTGRPSKGAMQVTVSTFKPLTRENRRLLDAATARLGQFLEMPAAWSL